MTRLLRSFLILISLIVFTSRGMAADDDISGMLKKWADGESRLKKAIAEGNYVNENPFDDIRKKRTLKIAQQIFAYAQDFKLRELKDLCEEIESYEDSIPYLKNKQLMSFAKDFITWYGGYKVRVTASVEHWQQTKISVSKLKRKQEANWQEGNPVQREVIDPNDTVEFHVGLEKIRKYRWNEEIGEDRFDFTPAREGGKKEVRVPNFKGGEFTIKCIFTAAPLQEMAKNRFPVRLLDFLHRYGKNAEALCEDDK